MTHAEPCGPTALHPSFDNTANSTDAFNISALSQLVVDIEYRYLHHERVRQTKPQAWANVVNFEEPFTELNYEYKYEGPEVLEFNDAFKLKWIIDTRNVPEVYNVLTFRPKVVSEGNVTSNMYEVLSFSYACTPA